MNVKLQLIIAITIVLCLIIIINMIRKNKLELKYALAWLFLGIGILIFDAFPSLTNFLSKLVGIGVPINMLFFLGFLFSLIIIFILTIVVSRLSNRVTRLTQQIALLEKKANDQESDKENV
jgi:hypothetical protein